MLFLHFLEVVVQKFWWNKRKRYIDLTDKSCYKEKINTTNMFILTYKIYVKNMSRICVFTC